MVDYSEFGEAEQVLRTVYDYCTIYVRTNKMMEAEEREAGTLTDKWLYYHMGADKLAFEIMRKLEVIYPDVFVKVYGAKKDD